MTETGSRIRSMRGQAAAIAVLGILIGLLMFFGARWLGNSVVDRWYLSPAAEQARTDAVADDLNAWLLAHPTASSDKATMRRWLTARRAVTVAVFSPEGAYEVDSWGEIHIPDIGAYRGLLVQNGFYRYTMPFSDGACEIAVIEYSEDMLYDIVTFAALFSAFVVLVLIIFVYSRWLGKRVSRLSSEVGAVSQGDLDREICTEGKDELARLARDVDEMRRTILLRVQGEQNALQANSELITALSHDIRNPLTALIGYLELLDMDAASLPEADRDYVRACLDKSYRIRDLTGEMFRYFLVFSEEAQDVHSESFDAQTLLWQMLGEYAVDLLAHGFRVETKQLETACTLHTDVNLLHRVVDNLISNAEKYADPDFPVVMEAAVQERSLSIRISNRIAPPRPGAVESNHVGLRTCSAIMRLLGGRFFVRTEGETFTAECVLPLEPGSAEESLEKS